LVEPDAGQLQLPGVLVLNALVYSHTLVLRVDPQRQGAAVFPELDLHRAMSRLPPEVASGVAHRHRVPRWRSTIAPSIGHTMRGSWLPSSGAPTGFNCAYPISCFLQVSAEGGESEDQLALLHDEGCREIQRFLL